VELKLEPARQVDIVSEPAGAKVSIDNVERGLTPLYDLLVPGERAFRVKLTRKGFKPWKQTLHGKKLRERLIEADLETLPLLAIPMSKEEREEAKDYDRKMNRIEQSIRNAKNKLAKAEKDLSAVESSPNIFIGRIADAQRDVDEVRTKLEELENEKVELDNALDMFRQKVMSKLEGIE
jgi:septal ring factor EnvC (AmiA/AmiB activator)